MGLQQAETQLRLFLGAGIGIETITYTDAVEAGRILCRKTNIPIADALIASIAKRLRATIVTDDPHFRELGVRTIWYK